MRSRPIEAARGSQFDGNCRIAHPEGDLATVTLKELVVDESVIDLD